MSLAPGRPKRGDPLLAGPRAACGEPNPSLAPGRPKRGDPLLEGPRAACGARSRVSRAASRAWARRLRLGLLGLTAAAALSGCYVAPLAPPGPPVAVVVRPAPHACWHPGWWGPWGWHPGHWGLCR